MILPSNDYYIANGNPFAHDISSVLNGGGPISFAIGLSGQINDAGTEINDFTTAAPPGAALQGLFPNIGLPTGQSGPNTGADQFGVNSNVSDAFGNFLNSEGVDISLLDFNQYANGIATVTITAVPEPSSLALFMLGVGGVVARRRKSIA